MTKKISKILAMLLAFTMFFMISVTAFADEETTAEEPVQEEIVAEEEPEKEEEPAKKEEPPKEEKPAKKEEAPKQEPVKEEEPPKADEPEEEEPSSFDDDDELVEIEDDWGYVSPEVIEQHTPAHTPEFIHADDPDWQRGSRQRS